MKSLTLGQYYPENSWLHTMDPRGKITFLFLYFLMLFILDDFWGLLFATVLGGVLVFGSRVPLRVYWRGSRFILLFIVLATMLNIFFSTGEVIWSWGILEITKEGLISAAVMVVRLVLLILSSYVLTYTTTPMELTNAIELMGSPLSKLGLPIHEIAMVMSIALRFIPTILEEAEIIKKAQQSRGVDFSIRSLGVSTENVVALVVPLFASAVNRSEELANAMEARGYSGAEGRTMYREMKLKTSDILFLSFGVIALAAAILYRWLL